MLNVAAFGIFGTYKLPARRNVIKKRAHLDLRSRSFTTVPHHFELTTIDDDFGSSDRMSLACRQPKSRDTSDAWQGFAPKSQRGHCLKISSRPDLTGRMPLQRKQRIVAVHSTSVVDHANERNSSATNDDIDLLCTGVDAVFDQ